MGEPCGPQAQSSSPEVPDGTFESLRRMSTESRSETRATHANYSQPNDAARARLIVLPYMTTLTISLPTSSRQN